MSQDIGWWNRDEEGKKYQVNLRIFGGKLKWVCQHRRFEPWEAYEPTDEDWERAIDNAEKRANRRLIDLKIVELIRRRGRA